MQGSTPDNMQQNVHGTKGIIIKIKIHSSCEIEDFVETHLCKLFVILQSHALRVVWCIRISWSLVNAVPHHMPTTALKQSTEVSRASVDDSLLERTRPPRGKFHRTKQRRRTKGTALTWDHKCCIWCIIYQVVNGSVYRDAYVKL